MSENLSLQFAHHGDPTKVLEMNEVPFDLSAPVAAGHVRVRIHARAINPADLLFVEGLYDSNVGDQIVAGRKQTGGSESSGVVLAVGEGVTSVAVGHRVYANSSMPATRTWAQVADVAAKNVIPLPPQVSFESGAQLLVNPLTAIGFLETMKETGLVEGDAFCLTAANSAVCKMVLQLHGLRKLNYKPVCIVRSRSAKAEVLALGAHSVIALEETTDLEAAVRAVAPKGLRAVFDALGGGPVVTTLATCLAERSTLYVYGALVREPLLVPGVDMLFRETAVAGWYLGHFLKKRWQEMPQMFGEVLQGLASGQLVFASKTFDFATQWREAVQYTLDGSKQGKTILVTK